MTFRCGLYPRSEFDLNVYTGRKLKTRQSFHGFVGRSEDVDESLVCSLLKLRTAVLVLVDGAEDGDNLFLRRKRNRAGNLGTGTLCGLYDFLRSGVNKVGVIAVQSDSDLLFYCHLDSS